MHCSPPQWLESQFIPDIIRLWTTQDRSLALAWDVGLFEQLIEPVIVAHVIVILHGVHQLQYWSVSCRDHSGCSYHLPVVSAIAAVIRLLIYILRSFLPLVRAISASLHAQAMRWCVDSKHPEPAHRGPRWRPGKLRSTPAARSSETRMPRHSQCHIPPNVVLFS
jgi:uncharacterized membrane protein